MSRYTKDELSYMRGIVDRATSITAGYREVAENFGVSETAIRCALQRHEGRRKRKATDILEDYAAKKTAKADRNTIGALEKEAYRLRSAVEAFGHIAAGPIRPVERCEFKSGVREATAVALFSDVHCEQIVRAGETPTGNEYNPAIAERSIARFFGAIGWKLDLYRPKFQIRNLVLWIGGDLMTGHIHEENIETTIGTPIETTLWLKSRLISGIDQLLEDTKLERLVVPCSYGNHGRNTRKPMRAKGAAHSYEWLLYQVLAGHYADNPRVQFLADQSAHQYVRVYDFDLHFHHGDEVNYGGGVGGIMIPINKAVAQWDVARRCHFHNFGHFHQYHNTRNVTVNGSVIGFEAYSMSIKAAPEDPTQAFYLIDSKRGKTCKSPIWVRERP